jgi:insulysin
MSEALQGFFQKYYSANIMTLAVLGPQGVDEMQSLVEGIFSAIPDKQIEMTFWNDPPYGEEELQRWIRIVPQSDTRSMYFTAPIPYGVPHYKTNVRFTEG